MYFGDLEIHLLSDGIVHVDPGGMFGLVPRTLYAAYAPVDDANLIPQSLTCMLVRSEGKTIVIDTGLGPKLTDKEAANWGIDRSAGSLVEHLARLGVAPADVDHVINTHLHWDHCGGNTCNSAEGAVATFSNATYWVQRLEWAEASHPDARTRGTYFGTNFEPMLRAGRLKLLHGDAVFDSHIRCVVTPGHTRAHQSILLESGDWKGMFLADMASFAVHMLRTAWLTAYDVLPLVNVRTKTRWQRWALDTGAWLFFQHDPRIPVARLEKEDGRLKLDLIHEAEELRNEIPTLTPLPG
jgi:glyoxylase-like metal-dependent hydrolase (beta-lactamase superfamily II)